MIHNIITSIAAKTNQYIKNKLSIDLNFYNNRFYNIDKMPSAFLKNQGYSWFKKTDFQNPSSKKFDFDIKSP